jgi:hypothetical protein
MLYDIIELRYAYDHNPGELLEEAVNDKRLIFNARSLQKIGFESLPEISVAVERAMTVCRSNGLSIKEHFKPIYLSDQRTHTVLKDWKLSKMAYMLAILNGPTHNSTVARLQLEMLKHYMETSTIE